MRQAAGNWEAFVRSDVFEGAVNEDGERPDELRYYVVCENEQGFRFRSLVSFTTVQFWRDAEARAESFCELVKRHLATGADPSKSEKWFAIQGCYGSAAWSDRLELELEARDLDMEAGHAEGDRFRRAAGIGL